MKKPIEPLVSVIIPAYNASAVVEESIRSMMSQTYRNIEIIVIDDKSSDNTCRLVEKLKLEDPRIILVENHINIGIGANRNRGIELARGDYICWQDADDISIATRIDHQLSYLQQHKEVGAVGGYIRFFDENGDGVLRIYSEKDSDLRRDIFKHNPIAQPALMIRAEVYSRVGGYDMKLRVSEDLDMFFRIGEVYKFANIQELVLMYRQSEHSLTRSKLREMEMTTFKIRSNYKASDFYEYSLSDGVYNFLQKISMVFPSNLRMMIFSVIRGDR